MENVRVEAFSGMAEELYDLIKQGHVEEYRRKAYRLRTAWSSRKLKADGCSGPVSFRPDGTVMALSTLPVRRRRLS